MVPKGGDLFVFRCKGTLNSCDKLVCVFYFPACCRSYGKDYDISLTMKISAGGVQRNAVWSKSPEVTDEHLIFNNKVQKLCMSLQWKILNVDSIPNLLILAGNCGLVMVGSWAILGMMEAKRKEHVLTAWLLSTTQVWNVSGSSVQRRQGNPF